MSIELMSIEPSSDKFPSHKKIILVVNNENELNKNVIDILIKAGYEVNTVTPGSENWLEPTQAGLPTLLVTSYSEDQDIKNLEAIRDMRYRLLFEGMVEAFALHEIVLDENGNPIDYIFLEVNPAFERLTGLKKEEIINKRVLEVLPNTEAYWIETYGNVALTGKEINFENYSVEMDKWFAVVAFSPQKGQFATIFLDITERKKAEKKLKDQLDELQRWHNITLGREERIIELKQEINQLLYLQGKPSKYKSVEED